LPVTILVNGKPVTYTDIDDPQEAYRRATGAGTPRGLENSFTYSPNSAGVRSTDSLNPSNIKQGIRKEVLTADPDWLAASSKMYEYTTGKPWKGSDAALGKWGLDRMAAFNYNLPRMSVDAIRIKSAPDDVKKSFLYLMEGFDRAAWTWGGVGSFLYHASYDPTTYVGLGTLGLGTVAGKALGEGAKQGVKELLKAGLKVGAVGAIEGGLLGATTENLTQTAKINAGGQKEKDLGRVATSAGIGAAAGFVLAPALTYGIGKAFSKQKLEDIHLKPTEEVPDAPLVPDAPEPVPDAPEPVTMRMDLRQPEYTQQPRFEGTMRTQQPDTVRQWQRTYQGKTPDDQPPFGREFVRDEKGNIVVDAQGIPETKILSGSRTPEQPSMDMPLPQEQLSLFPKDELPAQFGIGGRERREAAELRRQADLLEGKTSDGILPPKGREFFIDPETGRFAVDENGIRLTKPLPDDPETITRREAEIKKLREQADDMEFRAKQAEFEASNLRQEAIREGVDEIKDPMARPSGRPSPEERLDANGHTRDLVNLVRQLGSSNLAEQISSLRRLTKFTDPLTRALKNTTAKEAYDFVRNMLTSPLYNREARLLQNSLDNAVNMMRSETKLLVDKAEEIKRVAGDNNPEYIRLRDAANEMRMAFDPLRLMSKELKSQSARLVNSARKAFFKNEKRHADIDDILRSMGVDPATATPDQQFAATALLVDGAVEIKDKVARDMRIIDAKRALTGIDALNDPDGFIRALNDFANLQKTVEDEAYAALNAIGKVQDTLKRGMQSAANYIALTVLGPSSVTVNAASNFFRTVSRPMLDFLGKGPLESGAFTEMMIAYGAMGRTTRAAFSAARESFRIADNILLGHSNKWESDLTNHLAREGQNAVAGFLGRNYVKLWMRMLNSTDEFFAHWAYAGATEGKAYANALEEAVKLNLKGAERDKFIKDAIAEAQKKSYTSPDATMIAQLRNAAIEQGYKGDEVNLWVKKQLNERPDLYKRAADEEGISYANDLLFRTEFSGQGLLSGAAKGYESAVRQFPILRLAGQLFFRTPVRVFEAGIRLTPVVQFTPGTKFSSDLFGANGVAKQLKARGELMFSYGVMMATFTAYSNGTITGSGANLDYRERRRLEETEGWQPYSVKLGGKWYSFRNFDPFSTPLKIMVNALERYERMDMERAQGVFEKADSHKEMLAYMQTGFGSVMNAIKDANLASGAAEWIALFEAFTDPEKSEGKFVRMFKSKAQLLVPNSIRKGIKAFGEGQNVLTDPQTIEQSIEATINPSSESVTQTYDALGNKSNTIKQGFLYYLGIEALGKGQRGLDEESLWALREIAKMSIQTGAKFIPPAKSEKFYPGRDLRVVKVEGTNMTVYNAAMEKYQKLMKEDAIWYLRNSTGLSTGRRGDKGQRVLGFERLVKSNWEQALAMVTANDANARAAQDTRLIEKYNISQGGRDSFTALFNQ